MLQDFFIALIVPTQWESSRRMLNKILDPKDSLESCPFDFPISHFGKIS